MDFDKQLRLIEQAQGDPQKLALATLEVILSSLPQEMRRVIEIAAIPRWFDKTILTKLLDDDLRPKASHWYASVIKLSAVEDFPERKAYNVHETTRLALRIQLFKNNNNRFQELAYRAMEIFSCNQLGRGIEYAYHLIIADPNSAHEVIPNLNFNLKSNIEDGLALTTAFSEYAKDTAWPPSAQGWASLSTCWNNSPFITTTELIKSGQHAVESFKCANDKWGTALAQRELGSILNDGINVDEAMLHFQQSFNLLSSLWKTEPDNQHIARDTSVSLNKLGDFLLNRGGPNDSKRALEHYKRAFKICKKLYENDLDSVRAARDVSISFNKIGDFLINRGGPNDSKRAFKYYQQAFEICKKLYKKSPNSSQAIRDFSISLNKLGDSLLNRGKPDDSQHASKYYQQAFEICRQLYEDNPNSSQAVHDISISLNKLGDFLLDRGGPSDSALALEHYEQAFKICKRLYKNKPRSAQAARDVSISLNRLGNFLLDRRKLGDTELAYTYFKDALQIDQQLYKKSPNSSQAARDTSISLSRLGDFLLTRGQSNDLQLAFEYYQQAFKICTQLHTNNPDSAQAARDLSILLNRLGNLFLSRKESGDLQKAFKAYKQAFKICKRLYRNNPESAKLARDVSISLNRLGNFLLNRGCPNDGKNAFKYFKLSLNIYEQLKENNPNSAQAARDVSVSLNKLGDFLLNRGKPDDLECALRYFQRSLEICKQLQKDNPESAQAARDLSISLDKFGNFFLSRDKSNDAELALGYFQHSLNICEQLYQDNPSSAQAASDLSISHHNLATYHLQYHDQAAEQTHALACFTILNSLHLEKRPMSLYMHSLYKQLSERFLDENNRTT